MAVDVIKLMAKPNGYWDMQINLAHWQRVSLAALAEFALS